MAMKGPYREFIPVGEQRISMRLPMTMQAKQVKLLVANTNPKVEGKQELIITVPSITDHEVVAIDLDHRTISTS
jgi:hypothetical protein